MTRRRHLVLGLAFAATAALTLAGCASSGNDAGGDARHPPETTTVWSKQAR